MFRFLSIFVIDYSKGMIMKRYTVAIFKNKKTKLIVLFVIFLVCLEKTNAISDFKKFKKTSNLTLYSCLSIYLFFLNSFLFFPT